MGIGHLWSGRAIGETESSVPGGWFYPAGSPLTGLIALYIGRKSEIKHLIMRN